MDKDIPVACIVKVLRSENYMYACQHSLNTGMHNCLLMEEDLLSISPAGGFQLVKMLITFKLHGIFRIKFCILISYNIVQPPASA